VINFLLFYIERRSRVHDFRNEGKVGLQLMT